MAIAIFLNNFQEYNLEADALVTSVLTLGMAKHHIGLTGPISLKLPHWLIMRLLETIASTQSET